MMTDFDDTNTDLDEDALAESEDILAEDEDIFGEIDPDELDSDDADDIFGAGDMDDKEEF